MYMSYGPNVEIETLRSLTTSLGGGLLRFGLERPEDADAFDHGSAVVVAAFPVLTLGTAGAAAVGVGTFMLVRWVVPTIWRLRSSD